MKKAIALVLALCLALGLSASALAYADQNLQAPRAQNVVIDGDLSEWDTGKCLRIDSQGQIIDQIEHWDGAADCSMEAYAMWDEENLYLAMKIWDDTPLVYREGFPLDELDAVIFFLSTDPQADPDRTAYTATDWRIVQSAYGYKGEYEFFNYIDREMIADKQGWVNYAPGIAHATNRVERSEDTPADRIEIRSVREGAVPGIHTVTYESEDDMLELKHTIKNRRTLAMGAVVAAEFLCGKQGVFGMDDLLRN